MFKSWAEVSHMFWMVFGTFTNLFTFKENSWNKSKKNATCVAIGKFVSYNVHIADVNHLESKVQGESKDFLQQAHVS